MKMEEFIKKNNLDTDGYWHHILNINEYNIQYRYYNLNNAIFLIDFYFHEDSFLDKFKSKISIYSNNEIEIFLDVFANSIFKENLNNLNLNTIEDLIKFNASVLKNLAFL